MRKNVIIKILLIFFLMIVVFEWFIDFNSVQGKIAYVVALLLIIIFYNLLYLLDLLGVLFSGRKVDTSDLEIKKLLPLSKSLIKILPFQWCFYLIHDSDKKNRCVKVLLRESILRKTNTVYLYYSVINNKILAVDWLIILYRVLLVFLSGIIVKLVL